MNQVTLLHRPQSVAALCYESQEQSLAQSVS